MILYDLAMIMNSKSYCRYEEGHGVKSCSILKAVVFSFCMILHDLVMIMNSKSYCRCEVGHGVKSCSILKAAWWFFA